MTSFLEHFREQTGVPLPSASQTEDGIKLVMRGETGTLQPEIQKSYTCLPQVFTLFHLCFEPEMGDWNTNNTTQ